MWSSATRGQPLRPSRVATAPSCISAPFVSPWSSACWITTMPKVVAYSSARRITALSVTQRPSSLTATQPASRRSAISVSSRPSCPRVIAPMGCTRTRPCSRALATIISVMARLSFTGRVLGIAQTRVKPPAAAARVPDTTSSLYSYPGSRRWA